MAYVTKLKFTWMLCKVTKVYMNIRLTMVYIDGKLLWCIHDCWDNQSVYECNIWCKWMLSFFIMVYMIVSYDYCGVFECYII